MKCCVSTDVGTWTNLLTFEPDPDYSPDGGTGLLSPISFKRCYAEFYVGKIRCIRIGRMAAATTRGLKWFYGPPLQRGVDLTWFYWASESSKHLCRRYMRSTECPSSFRWFWVTLRDSEIFTDTKHRVVSLRQLSLLLKVSSSCQRHHLCQVLAQMVNFGYFQFRGHCCELTLSGWCTAAFLVIISPL